MEDKDVNEFVVANDDNNVNNFVEENDDNVRDLAEEENDVDVAGERETDHDTTRGNAFLYQYSGFVSQTDNPFYGVEEEEVGKMGGGENGKW
ncbi:hypothetical protein VNO78_15112 [Psophocarpus tetragonolobus]|uniref:Uncharacterized protein n=1 Tax=Psophocarpus tetragonolobus TaxID=3891 RepID=A0AAN9SEG7_PSOTE